MDYATPGVGTLLAERYRLTRPLGSGASAVVWEAWDIALGRMVAAKLLHGAAMSEPGGREQLRREAQALARLAHPRITTVFDYIEPVLADGWVQPVLVTELLRGQGLDERLAAGPLSAGDVQHVCTQLVEALRAAHAAGIVHRDLKPANVMLTAEGVKLLDFGIAQIPSDTAATGNPATGSLAVGTPACMSPEQLTGRPVTAASDMYAFGCVLYWCLVGRPPFDGATIDGVVGGHLRAAPPRLAVPGLPARVVGLYWSLLAKDPARRPTADAALAVLEEPVAGRASLSAPAAGVPPMHRTMVMPAYEVPEVGSAYDFERLAAEAPRGRPSRALPAVGGVVIAALAAGATALALHGGTQTPGPNAAGAATTSVAPLSSTPFVSIPSASTQTTDPSSATPNAGAPPTNPGGDPMGYLEAMRVQIQGMIAQGADTIDPNGAGDLQNAIADLENSVVVWQGSGNSSKKLRDVKSKIDGVTHKISGLTDDTMIGRPAADVLNAELRDLKDSIGQN